VFGKRQARKKGQAWKKYWGGVGGEKTKKTPLRGCSQNKAKEKVCIFNVEPDDKGDRNKIKKKKLKKKYRVQTIPTLTREEREID